jgi:hypothetical protein
LRHESSALVCRREGKKKSIEGYSALAVRCTALESLCCDNAADDPDDQILQLVSAQKGLRNIDFLDLPIEDKFLDPLADKCPQLHEILLQGTPPMVDTPGRELQTSATHTSVRGQQGDHEAGYGTVPKYKPEAEV